jgi:hypothetical protein
VVICNEGGLPKLGASAEFVGQESLFRPALNHLETNDRVGVAHWCDNGDSDLDLLPTQDRDKAIHELAEALKPIPFEEGTSASDEAGEQRSASSFDSSSETRTGEIRSRCPSSYFYMATTRDSRMGN